MVVEEARRGVRKGRGSGGGIGMVPLVVVAGVLGGPIHHEGDMGDLCQP